MQKIRPGFVLFTTIVALCGGLILAQAARPDAKNAVRQIEPEFDPDAGTESPQEEAFEGVVAGSADDCESIGGFTTTFTFAARYRGNLYRISDSGVFLKEIKMQLAFAGVADLYVSVHRKLPNGSYQEVDINPGSDTQGFAFISDAQGLGLTVPAFYSTGEFNGSTGVELVPGDYAIGFAWGPESIKYGRDAGVSYPRPIEVGSILSSVSRELPQDEPPLPANLATLSQFAGGTYAQQLCFVPVEGACCRASSQTCVNVLETQCTGEGSFFHGQRTTCKDTICEFGACCFECDDAAHGYAARCEDDYTQQFCAAAGGVRFWAGAICSGNLCPKVVGACCNGVNCSIKCRSECEAGGGTYDGDGTDCDPNTHRCKGACCVTGGCLDRTQAGCTGVGGDFKGPGSRCFSETCDGACCHGFLGYEDCNVWDRDLCIYDPENFPYIAYRGDGRSCPGDCDAPIGDPYIACCLPDGRCMNTFANVCTASWIQGSPQNGQLCEDIVSAGVCSNATARCCLPNGDCEIITGNACDARGGVPVAGEDTCPSDACSNTVFSGACCGSGVGACSLTTALECSAQGGTYKGTGTNCANAEATCPGYGACCRGNAECLDHVTQDQCNEVAGVYRGASTTCAQVACDLRGACCAVTGTCLFTTVTTCVGLGGDFKGAGAVCTPGLCPAGACCLPEGCRKRTPLACATSEGEYKGNNVACQPTTCVVQGGCCRDGVCTVEAPDACTSNGGIYLGNGTDCGENACTTGACCRIDGACVNDTEQGGCQGPGEVFHTGQACATQCVPHGACCDGNDCIVTTVGQCPGTYLGDGVSCGIDTCDPLGACCIGTQCSLRTQINCATSGGQYQGNGSSCDSNTCNPTTGACCNGTTCEPKTQAECVSGGGEYEGDNILCEPNPCSAPVTGACCDGSDCTITTPAACTGTYEGDDTVCIPDPCQAGPCTAITSMVPNNCSIDAARPYPPNNPGTPQGWTNIGLSFDCDTSGHTLGDYSVSVVGTGPPPTVLSLMPNGTDILVTLSGPITPGDWTCITYLPAGIMKCLGYLPGDVSGNRATLPTDLLELIDNLNGIHLPPLNNYQCDIDRSNVCAPADLLTLIDLLNGTTGFAVWNGRTLPACPSP